MILVQRLIPAERIGDQRPGKTSQESLDIALAPGLSILVQDDRLFFAMLGSSVYKHVGLGSAGTHPLSPGREFRPPG